MSGNKPAGQETDQELWNAYVDIFRPAESTIDITTPCLEFQCWRLEDIGRAFRNLEGDEKF